MRRGLVIGKFYPPHNGHHFLIEVALEESDYVDVLVCDNPQYKIPASRRASWLRMVHPRATVRVIPDLYDDDNSQAWADHTIRFLGYAPDTVFTSEDYGNAYANFLGCKHRLVDKERLTVPISASIIRQNFRKHWSTMHPITRGYLATRIVVIGAESTGTTTLSLALAKIFNAAWTPEIGRYYTKSLLNTSHLWTDSDFVRIASMQQMYEDTISEESDGIIVCDTNAFATKIWQQRYMGRSTSTVENYATNAPAGLYIVTGDEIPFVQDGTRDGQKIRHTMHRQFIDQLEKYRLPYIVVRGTIKARLLSAEKEIRKILDQKKALV